MLAPGLADDSFPENGKNRRVEFPVPGRLIPANGNEFADRGRRESSSKRLFLRRKRDHEFEERAETGEIP